MYFLIIFMFHNFFLFLYFLHKVVPALVKQIWAGTAHVTKTPTSDHNHGRRVSRMYQWLKVAQ